MNLIVIRKTKWLKKLCSSSKQIPVRLILSVRESWRGYTSLWCHFVKIWVTKRKKSSRKMLIERAQRRSWMIWWKRAVIWSILWCMRINWGTFLIKIRWWVSWRSTRRPGSSWLFCSPSWLTYWFWVITMWSMIKKGFMSIQRKLFSRMGLWWWCLLIWFSRLFHWREPPFWVSRSGISTELLK